MIYRIVLIGLCAALALQAYAQDADIIAKRYFENAYELYQSGKYDQALPDLKLLLRKYKTSAYGGKASFLLGRYYYEVAQDTAKAFQYFTDTIEIATDFDYISGAYYYMGIINSSPASSYYDLNKAMANFKRIVTIYPNALYAPKALHHLALLFEENGEYKPATWFMESFLSQIDPNEASEAYAGLSRMYVKRKLLDQALLAAAKGLIYAKTPYEKDLSRAQARHLLRFLMFEKKHIPLLYTPSQLLLRGPQKRVISLVSDVKHYYALDSKLDSLMMYNRDGSFERTMAADLEHPVRVAIGPKGQVVVNDGERILIDAAIVRPDTTAMGTRLDDFRWVSLDSKSNIFLVDGDHDSVVVLDSEGRYDREIFKGYIKGDELMCVNVFDQVILVRPSFDSIGVMSTDGKFITKKSMQEASYAIEDPIDLVSDFMGNLYIMDEQGTIWIYDFNLQPIHRFSLPSLGIGRPRSLGLLVDGSISIIGRNYDVALLQ